MKNKTYRIIVYAISIIPLLIAALVYSKLPALIPTNWGINGEVTYSGKSSIWITSCLSLGLAILFDVVPHIDPRKQNYDKFGKYYDLFALFMVVFLLILNVVTITESFYPGTFSVGKLVVFLLGILFIFLGNILPKVKSTFFFGIKTPWTLSDANIWNKTHRLGGRLLFICGIIAIISSIFLSDAILFIVFMTSLIIAVMIPSIMSYIWYRQLPLDK